MNRTFCVICAIASAFNAVKTYDTEGLYGMVGWIVAAALWTVCASRAICNRRRPEGL